MQIPTVKLSRLMETKTVNGQSLKVGPVVQYMTLLQLAIDLHTQFLPFYITASIHGAQHFLAMTSQPIGGLDNRDNLLSLSRLQTPSGTNFYILFGASRAGVSNSWPAVYVHIRCMYVYGVRTV